jgi:hypothetical protein
MLLRNPERTAIPVMILQSFKIRAPNRPFERKIPTVRTKSLPFDFLVGNLDGIAMGTISAFAICSGGNKYVYGSAGTNRVKKHS